MDEIGLLAELVSIRSVGPDERKLAERLEILLSGLGFSTERLEVSPGRFNVLATRGGEGKPIGLYGHMDTVGPAEGWKTDPFKLTEEDGRLIGLGAWDMKAGVCAILCAAGDSKRPVKIAFGVDEENISEGAHAIVRSGFFHGCEAIISTDTGGDGGEHLGERQLTLGRLGRAVYEFTVPGKAAHGADSGGVNAITEGAKLIRELANIKPKTHKLLPRPPIFVRSFHGQSESLSLPDSARIELDRHLVPPETSASVLNELRYGIDHLYEKGVFRPIGGRKIEVSLKARKTPYLTPQITERTEAPVKRMEKMIAENFGKPRIVYGNSVADENVLALSGVPVITYGPSGGGMHSAGEWVSKESHLNIIKGLRAFLQAE
ncbi:MAG: M20/M25/M40 family metallo-hydrolase [Candidatus Micrarchaeia archaeon]